MRVIITQYTYKQIDEGEHNTNILVKWIVNATLRWIKCFIQLNQLLITMWT